MLSHDVWEEATRALRARRNASSGEGEHQRLCPHTAICGFSHAKVVRHKNEHRVRRIKARMIAYVRHLASDKIAPFNTHGAIELLCGGDLSFAIDANKFPISIEIWINGLIAHTSVNQGIPKIAEPLSGHYIGDPRLH